MPCRFSANNTISENNNFNKAIIIKGCLAIETAFNYYKTYVVFCNLGENGGSGPQNGPGGLSGNNPEETTTAPNLPTPTKGNAPCDKTKSIYNNTAVKSRYEVLKGKTSEPSESGYGFKTVSDGNGGTTIQTNPLNPDTNPDKMKVSIFPTSYGFIHTHLDKAEGKLAIKIFSPADINAFLSFLRNAKTNGIPLNSIFGGMIASDPETGYNIYQMTYTGDGTDLPAEFTKPQLDDLRSWILTKLKKWQMVMKELYPIGITPTTVYLGNTFPLEMVFTNQ